VPAASGELSKVIVFIGLPLAGTNESKIEQNYGCKPNDRGPSQNDKSSSEDIGHGWLTM
jgi:hypothetical protein